MKDKHIRKSCLPIDCGFGPVIYRFFVCGGRGGGGDRDKPWSCNFVGYHFCFLNLMHSFHIPVLRHCKEDPIYVFPDLKLCGLVPSCHIHVSVSDLCIPRSETVWPRSQLPHSCIYERFMYSQDPSAYFAASRPILGIYRPLTDTWLRKLGARLRSFTSGNICKFSVQCLCSGGHGDEMKLFSIFSQLYKSAFQGFLHSER